jgi:formamidopyrimidine-DNA glycosylase
VPELPETETLARDLNAGLAGRVIAKVEVLHADVLRAVTARGISRKLKGRTFGRAWRRAKSVVLDLDDDLHLVVVPRFTGGLLLRAGLPDDRYDAIRFRLADDATLAYRDVRRLGTVTLCDAEEFSTFDQRLGKEPLDPAFTPGELSALLESTQQPVK